MSEIERLRAQTPSLTELVAEIERLRLQCSQWEMMVNERDAEIARLRALKNDRYPE